MKKIIAYAMVGVVSAGTTFGLIKYTEGELNANQAFNSNSITTSTDENGSQFATYDYTSTTAALPDFTSAAEKTVNTVVSITNYGDQSTQYQSRGQSPFGGMFDDPFFDQFFNMPRRQQQTPQNQNQEPLPMGAGSGVIISPDGYIVTNNHVIQDATKLEVTLNNQQSYTATVVGTDPNTDIALIKIDEDDLPYLSFYNSDALKVGEWVLAVGNPFGLNSTVTAGIVSAKGRSIDILRRNSDHPIESFIQTDAAINPGNSGGALVNTSGNLVGINSAIFSKTGSYSGYGFAVPSNLVKKIVDDIKNYGMVQRGYIGVQGFDLSNEQQVRAYNMSEKKKLKTGKGIYVTDVSDNGGAKDAGIRQDDIIIEIDGQEVNSFATLSLAVARKNPGDKVNVSVLRDNKKIPFQVTLKDLKGNTKIRTKEDLTVSEKLGASFEPLSDNQKMQYGIRSGVMVTNVNKNSTLSEIGIREGYIILKVNDKEVNSEKDINKILKKYNGNVSINYVDRHGRIYTRGFAL